MAEQDQDERQRHDRAALPVPLTVMAVHVHPPVTDCSADVTERNAMAKFSAAGIVEPLDYDFTDLKDEKRLEDVEGTITEPTSKQVRAFNLAAPDDIRRLSAELAKAGEEADDELPGLAGVAAVLETLSMRSAALSEEAVDRKSGVLSVLWSRHPTAAHLEKLPYRIMSAFAAWVTKEVMDPEAVTGGGGAQVVNLRSSAAG